MPRLLWLLGRVTDLVVTLGEVVVQRGGRKKLGAALRQVQCKRKTIRLRQEFTLAL
jgi:hypothetical protein